MVKESPKSSLTERMLAICLRLGESSAFSTPETSTKHESTQRVGSVFLDINGDTLNARRHQYGYMKEHIL